jgi:hypothetical protein
MRGVGLLEQESRVESGRSAADYDDFERHVQDIIGLKQFAQIARLDGLPPVSAWIRDQVRIEACQSSPANATLTLLGKLEHRLHRRESR